MSDSVLDEDELRELSLSIAKLPKSELQELHRLIVEQQPAYRARGIDLNALEDGTLLVVQQFVRTSCVAYKNMSILITDSPKEVNIHYYLETFRKHHVTDVVRTCEADYNKDVLEHNNIQFHEMRFRDGDVASAPLIDDWLDLVDECYFHAKATEVPRKIAVHCAAGMGRAPFLVALALVHAGMDNFEAVEHIRDVRKGAINARQLEFILKFKPRKKSTFKRLFKFL